VDQTRAGDKVKMKVGEHKGKKGVVTRLAATNRLIVQVHGSKRPVEAFTDDVTNFSLAARRAWKSMPARKVGRPKGARSTDRVSVTLRIDRDLWEDFRRKEHRGLITDRTAIINLWMRQKLKRMTSTNTHFKPSNQK
jgi:uncharacterized protein (DUF4415 family)